jgi:arylformamidase
MSVHNGTHADAQFHFDPAGATIERARLETYFGRAVVVDLTAQFSSGQKEFIEIDHLQAQTEEIGESTRLLIKTGVWKDSTVFPAQIPVLAAGVAPWLRQSGVKLLGLDVPSVDAIDAKILTNHHALAAAEIAIIESLDLTGVEAGVYNFMALPLKIRGSDGAPVRAVLWRD